jgi:hypothetical protein
MSKQLSGHFDGARAIWQPKESTIGPALLELNTANHAQTGSFGPLITPFKSQITKE